MYNRNIFHPELLKTNPTTEDLLDVNNYLSKLYPLVFTGNENNSYFNCSLAIANGIELETKVNSLGLNISIIHTEGTCEIYSNTTGIVDRDLINPFTLYQLYVQSKKANKKIVKQIETILPFFLKDYTLANYFDLCKTGASQEFYHAITYKSEKQLLIRLINSGSNSFNILVLERTNSNISILGLVTRNIFEKDLVDDLSIISFIEKNISYSVRDNILDEFKRHVAINHFIKKFNV